MGRLAIIFHGIIGGMAARNGIGQPSDIDICFKTIKHNILDIYPDHDIFMHSWSIDFKDKLVEMYNPKSYLFEKQENFGYTGDMASLSNEGNGQAFRTISKYTSLERANKLRIDYEKINNIQYDWILVLRYDLIFFTKLNLEKYDNSIFYICNEPNWENDIHRLKMIHDIIFLAAPINMNKFCSLAEDFRNNKHKEQLHSIHHTGYSKLIEVMNNDISKIKYGFNRYIDIEIYRLVIYPEQNPVYKQYEHMGSMAGKKQLECLLKEIQNG